ncbi:MAG: SDR family oxidoreductase, partial [Pseudomonadota bacterium]
MNVKDRVAFVTGANRGIGRAIVEALLEAGASKVYAGARKIDSLPDFGDDRVVPVAVDVTDADTVAAAAEQASDVAILFNNAGTLQFGSLLDEPVETVQADMNVNYFGTLAMTRAFAPVLERNKNAAIVNVASIVAFVNMPGIGGYSASKAALFSMSQGLRIELAPRGISVHTVNPGPIDTDMAASMEMEKATPEDTARNILA